MSEQTAEDEKGWFDFSAYRQLSPEAKAASERMVKAMRTPLAPGDPRDHHYIPRWFLRRFSDHGAIIRVPLDQPDERQPGNVDTVGFVRDFYTTIHNDIGSTVVVERLLAEIDGSAASAVKRLADGSFFFPPSPADRINIATWLALLFVRTPAHRRFTEAITDASYKLHMSTIRDEESARFHLRRDGEPEPSDHDVARLLAEARRLDDIEIVPHQNTMVMQMLEFGFRMVPFFLNRHWLVIRFPEDGLILPDQPITLYSENQDPLRGIGLYTAEQLVVPLDRRTALVMHFADEIGDHVMDGDAHKLDDFNQLIVGAATTEVFCHPDDVGRVGAIRLPDANRPLMLMDGGWPIPTSDGVNSAPKRLKPRKFRFGAVDRATGLTRSSTASSDRVERHASDTTHVDNP